MLNITRRDLDDAYKSMRDAHSYIQQYKQGGERITGQLLQSAEVAGGALAVGVASGRYGALTIAGSQVPLDLAAGILGHGLAFFGLPGKYSEHLHNVSDGAIAAYLTKWGIGYGTEMRRKASLPAVFTVAGEGPSSNHGPASAPQMGCGNEQLAPMTEAELAGMAHSIR